MVCFPLPSFLLMTAVSNESCGNNVFIRLDFPTPEFPINAVTLPFMNSRTDSAPSPVRLFTMQTVIPMPLYM